MKRAPPNSPSLSEPPLSKKIRIGAPVDVDDNDGEDGPVKKKTSGPYVEQDSAVVVGGSEKNEEWTRVEKRKHKKKAKKQDHKADVCVFPIYFSVGAMQ